MEQRERAYLARIEIDIQLARFPNYGLWHLTIPEAAELVALDMWYSGELSEINEPEDWDGTERDPQLQVLLMPAAKNFEARLIAAVEKGTLKPAQERRDFDDRLIPDGTAIEYESLASWLNKEAIFLATYSMN